MEKLDPSKFHTLNMKYKNWYITGVVFFLLVVTPVVSYLYYKAALTRPAQGLKEVSFEIIDGDSVSAISQRLYEDELVNSAFLFKVHLISQGLHTKIQAGVYRIPAGASIKELSELFLHGTNDVSITFLEGWRVEEFAIAAAQNFRRVEYTKFVELAREKEGQLFPDTYFFGIDATEEEIIDRLTETYDIKTSSMFGQNDLEEVGLTQDEALIFASIVEREVRDEEDRPTVAGILIKRWKNGELIGADATTQYAIATLELCDSAGSAECPTAEQAMAVDWWPAELTRSDLDFESPYNTRAVVGLPPKPIANPGINAIEAVMNYEETPFNYYLTDKNGITHYATTLEDHNLNVARHL